MKIKQPYFTVDCIVFDPADRLLLIRRRNPPFQGQHALPGGFIEYGETVEQAVARELQEETDLIPTKLSLVGVYSDPNRDPRSHVVSIAYLVSAAHYEARAGSDASDAAFVANWRDNALAFDHGRIVGDARLLLKR